MLIKVNKQLQKNNKNPLKIFAGPFTDSIRKMDNQEVRDIVCPASGVHIILPDYYSPANMVNFILLLLKIYIYAQINIFSREIAGTN